MDDNDDKKPRTDLNDTMYEVEILSRLRLETLQTCKLVSKRWLEHIETPYFFTSHLQKSIQYHHLNLIFYNRTTESVEAFDAEELLPSAKPYNLSLTKSHTIVGSCNGLVCFQYGKIYDGSQYNFLVYNPATRVKKSFLVVLPGRSLESNLENISECGLLNNNKGFGFVCDNNSMDHKFVFIEGREIYVYSLKSLSWKKIRDYSCKSCLWKTKDQHRARGVPTNNALHWLYGNQFGDKGIFSLDLTTDKQYITPLDLKNIRGKPRLVPLGGRLHLVSTKFIHTLENASHLFEIEIWRMKKYGSFNDSWVRLFKVILDDTLYFAIPITIAAGGRKVLLELCYQRDREEKKYYVWYDLITKKHGFKIHEVSSKFIAEPCLETLVDPRCEMRA